MRLAGGILCILLGLACLLLAVDASGSLQDAPPNQAQMANEVPFVIGSAVFELAGVGLIVWHVQRKRLS